MNFERVYDAPSEQEILGLLDLTKRSARVLVDASEFVELLEKELSE